MCKPYTDSKWLLITELNDKILTVRVFGSLEDAEKKESEVCKVLWEENCGLGVWRLARCVGGSYTLVSK